MGFLGSLEVIMGTKKELKGGYRKINMMDSRKREELGRKKKKDE